MSSASKKSPLRIMFLTTSMPVGGAEILLLNLVRKLDRDRFAPEIGCLKEPDELGEQLAAELPLHSHLLRSKYDLRILPRLRRLFRDRKIDAVVTVGCGDKMFWGRLAARWAGVPVVASALHSTGWPDGVGRLNRWLTPLTDAFIGVADDHAKHLIEYERFPEEKVHTIYNGVDTERFSPGEGQALRDELGIAHDAPVLGILAALRPEKNHELFLAGAEQIRKQQPNAKFLVIGDGPCRGGLENLAAKLGIADAVLFLGSRPDVPELLRTLDLLALTSHNEASPVSILEALSSGVPVVAANVGSVHETVVDGQTGLLFEAGDEKGFVSAALALLGDAERREQMGQEGRRRVVRRWSLDAMVRGYETLIEGLYYSQCESIVPSSQKSIKSLPQRGFTT